MKNKKPNWLLAISLVLVVGLISQGFASAPVNAQAPAQQGGTGTWQEAELKLGEAPKRNLTPKPDGLIQNHQEKLNPAPPSNPVAPPDGQNDLEIEKRTEPTRSTRAMDQLMGEGFEGTFPSGLWNVFDGDGATNGEYFWDEDDYLSKNGSYSAWAAKGGADGMDPEYYYYPDYANSWMIYGPVNLSTYTYADVLFSFWNNSEEGYDYFGWYASVDGTNFYGYQTSGDSGGWQDVLFDLTTVPTLGNLAGETSVYIAFIFQSDESNFSDGPFVDDISIWGEYVDDPADWTFMVYLDGDNNLEAAGIDDFLEMSSVGSDSNVNIVVQFDRISGYDTSYDDWTDTRRFLVTPGMTPTSANGVSMGELNMGDPNTLVDFTQWAMSTYPADNYALVLWDHGAGWRLKAQEQLLTKDIAYDDSSGGDGINMTELRNALDTITTSGANPIQLLGMDACLMAMIEVDNQLIPYANVRVGSEDLEPGDGWPYDTVLTALTGTPTMSASALGTIIVDDYYASYGDDETQSGVYLGTEYGTLNTEVNDFAIALINDGASFAAELATARNNTQEFDTPEYIDLYDFAYQVNLNVTHTAINNAASDVMTAVNNAVFREQHGTSWPGGHGISIYFPEVAGAYDTRYDGSSGYLQFSVNTQWDEWLNTFYGFSSGSPDLIVQSISPDPANPAVSEAVEFTVTIKNQGTGTAPAGWYLDLYFDYTPTGCGDYSSYYDQGSSILPDDTEQFIFSYPGFSTEGSHYVTAQVDSGCSVTESDETNNIYLPALNILVGKPAVVADFDGNGSTDVSFYRPSTGMWYIKDQYTTPWGTSGDIPVPGDYDGNGSVDVAVYRPSTGKWFIKGQYSSTYGTSSDVPVPGDYNGDGITDIAIFRPSTGKWFIKGQYAARWGTSADIPIPGDYNGDGITDIAIYRPATGKWFIKNQYAATYGQSGDIPIPGDYDGNGTWDVAIFRPSVGKWFIKGQYASKYGTSSDIPTPGDYDGNGVWDVAFYRPSNGTWYIKGQFSTVYGGSAGDFPLPVRDTNADGDPYH